MITVNDTKCIENSEDPDQLASVKPSDQDPHCFSLCKYVLNCWILQVNCMKIGRV